MFIQAFSTPSCLSKLLNMLLSNYFPLLHFLVVIVHQHPFFKTQSKALTFFTTNFFFVGFVLPKIICILDSLHTISLDIKVLKNLHPLKKYIYIVVFYLVVILALNRKKGFSISQINLLATP
jgi:hypothetical protein